MASLYSSAGVCFSEEICNIATGTEEASRRIIIGGEISGGSCLTTVWEIAVISASAPDKLTPGWR